jgi:hypothetical protein
MGGADYWGFAFPPSLAPLFSSAGLFCLSKLTRDCQRITPRRCLRCLGVHSGHALWGVGTPEISMASEYDTGVSGGFRQAGNNVALSRALLSVGTYNQAPRSFIRRRLRREVADVKHRPQQFGLRQDDLRLRNHVRGRVFAARNVVVEQRLDLGHALTDFPDRFVDYRCPLTRYEIPLAQAYSSSIILLGCRGRTKRSAP